MCSYAHLAVFFYCLSNYQLLTVATAPQRCELCFLQLSPVLSTLLNTFAKRTPMISSPLCLINCSWLSGLAAITFFNKLKNPDTGFCSSFQSGGGKIIITVRFLGSHSSVAEGTSIVGCDTVSLGQYILTFQRITVPASSWPNSVLWVYWIYWFWSVTKEW